MASLEHWALLLETWTGQQLCIWTTILIIIIKKCKVSHWSENSKNINSKRNVKHMHFLSFDAGSPFSLPGSRAHVGPIKNNDCSHNTCLLLLVPLFLPVHSKTKGNVWLRGWPNSPKNVWETKEWDAYHAHHFTHVWTGSKSNRCSLYKVYLTPKYF